MTGSRLRRAFFCAAFALVAAGQAWAHEFHAALVVPLSGARAADGTAFLQGFRVATRERDGHPAETSDGHLGGLDVQMHPVDAGDGLDAVLDALAGLDAPVIVIFGAPDWLGTVTGAHGNAAVMLPGRLPDAERVAGSDLPESYAQQYGGTPGPAAQAGYNAARRIDLAVRAQGGVDDIDALRAALAETADGFDW